MEIINKIKNKKAVSPILATMLLISLVVVASSMVYFLVVPMLRGNEDLTIVNAQWFDSDGDTIVDVVYVRIQNTGTATSTIEAINITLTNSEYSNKIIENAILTGNLSQLLITVGETRNLEINFDATEDIRLGKNEFNVRITYAEGDISSFLSPSLRGINEISELSLSIVNPINGSWYNGILDPHATASGGYNRSAITYDFYFPNGTLDENKSDQPLSSTIDTIEYDNIDGYVIVFKVNDSLGQFNSKNRTIGIDNSDPIIESLQLNSSESLTINQGEAVEIEWSISNTGSDISNVTVVLSGTDYFDQLFTASDNTTTTYILSSTYTSALLHGDYTVTLYTRDEAGNTAESGRTLTVTDIIPPDVRIDDPVNGTTIDGSYEFTVYADDISGIDTSQFRLRFVDAESPSTVYYTFKQSVEGTASYSTTSNEWSVIIDTTTLENAYMKLTAVVWDNAGNSNTTSVNITVDNSIISVGSFYHVDGEGGGIFLTLSNQGTTEISVTKVKVDWTSTVDGYICVAFENGTDYAVDPVANPGYGKNVEVSITYDAGTLPVAASESISLRYEFKKQKGASPNYDSTVTSGIYTFYFYIDGAWTSGYPYSV